MLEREGQGWRLAWDGQRDPFPLLIGGEGWASELTANEASALGRALEALSNQRNALRASLMEEENLCLEFHGPCPDPKGGTGGALWVALEGDRQEWTLSFVLQPATGARGLEGSWGEGAAAAFMEAFLALVPCPQVPNQGGS